MQNFIFDNAIKFYGSLSLKHIEKDKPPFIYVENSDFVSQTQDKVKISVQNNFEKIPIANKKFLVKNFKLPNMTEMESGKLKNIFENWRKGNAV